MVDREVVLLDMHQHLLLVEQEIHLQQVLHKEIQVEQEEAEHQIIHVGEVEVLQLRVVETQEVQQVVQQEEQEHN
jgi:hypothetical protein